MTKAATVSVSEKVISYLNKILEKSNKTLGKVAGEIIEKLLDEFTAEELANEIKDLSYSSEDKIVCVISPNITPDKFNKVDKIRSSLNLARSEVLRALLELTLRDMRKLREGINLSILKNSLSFIKNLARLTGKSEVLIIFRILEVIYEDSDEDILFEIIKLRPPLKHEDLDDIKVKLPLNAKQHFENLSNDTGIILPYIISRFVDNFTNTYNTENAKKILFPEFIKIMEPKIVKEIAPEIKEKNPIKKIYKEERKTAGYYLYTSMVQKLDNIAKKYNRSLEAVASDFLDNYIENTPYEVLISEIKSFKLVEDNLPKINLTLSIDPDTVDMITELSKDSKRSKANVARCLYEKIFEKRQFRFKERPRSCPYRPKTEPIGAMVSVGVTQKISEFINSIQEKIKIDASRIIFTILNTYNISDMEDLIKKADFLSYKKEVPIKYATTTISLDSWDAIINLTIKYNIPKITIMIMLINNFIDTKGIKELEVLLKEKIL